MRFIANGPSIPDDLLLARDQGRVVFFCGAGVSRAKAGFADFFGLASSVTTELGVQADSAATKLLNAAQTITDITGVESVISADKIFGLLERDFCSTDIYQAVAKALTPQPDVDLSAHRTMQQLATTPDGAVRLVTTNFDRLFDITNPKLSTFIHPQLPDLLRPDEFNGVVYLHGKVNENGTGAENNHFVLSSSEFGEAYLANGWATSFVKSILDKYVVVFVGYSADDPPIQYLLEALNKSSNRLNDIYAFQIGSQSEASEKWGHKGVKAIPFDQFETMWETLELWSKRAENPSQWYQSVIAKAKLGPQQLKPFERGQIAHIVSHVEGMKQLHEANDLLPASWLHVFDPKLRYERPKQSVDPFDLYSLDSDLTPRHIAPDGFYAKREAPQDAWNAFVINSEDLKTPASNLDSFWGDGVYLTQRSTLPSRLNSLVSWLGKVADQPEAIWWAVQQPNLHPWVKQHIKSKLLSAGQYENSVISSAWLYLLDFFDNNKAAANFDNWYDFKKEIKKTGWTNRGLRHFVDCSQPYIKVALPHTKTKPLTADDLCLEHLIERTIVYPKLPIDLVVPENWLYPVTRAIRRNLEVAVELELEISGYRIKMLPSIIPEDGRQASRSSTHGLFSWVLLYVEYLEKLLIASPSAAEQEVLLWPNDDTLFAKLKMWALGKENLIPNNRFLSVLNSISDTAFWDPYHQRDLLLSIGSRWQGLNLKTKQRIEKRILSGPPIWNDEEKGKYKERKARWILVRLEWLKKQGCVLKVAQQKIIDKLKKDAPDWKPDFANEAVRSHETKSGFIGVSEDHSSLNDVPLKEILVKSKEISNNRLDMCVKYDPFLGLSRDKPVRAFSALRLSLKSGEVEAWAWDRFLYLDSRKEDNPKLMRLIAATLLKESGENIKEIIRPICYWLSKSGAVLANKDHDKFVGLVKLMIDVIKQQPSKGLSSIIRSSDNPDWVNESINSPVGYLFEALFYDPSIENREGEKGFSANWLCLLEELLGLPNDLRRYTLASAARKLSWFFSVDSTWTKAHLLSVLESKDEDHDAFWAGVFSAGVRGKELFYILKPSLIKLSYSEDFDRNRPLERVVGFVFSAWTLMDTDSSERWLSDAELRKILIKADDAFRCHLLEIVEQGDAIEWLPNAEKLLANVWPRQRVARSSKVSFALCELAFCSTSGFVSLVELILPLLTKFNRIHHMNPCGNDLAREHPVEFLSVLDAVLPDDSNIWPHDIGECIEELTKTNTELKKDKRFIELRRKWDSRAVYA